MNVIAIIFQFVAFVQVAQRCFAALGNASKAFYLSETMKIAEKYEETSGPGLQCPEVRVRLALLNADLRFVNLKWRKFLNKSLFSSIKLNWEWRRKKTIRKNMKKFRNFGKKRKGLKMKFNSY